MSVRIGGEVRVPGDKSLTHRALMLAAAARGESRLRGLLAGGDCRSTAAVLRALGCEIPEIPADGGEIVIVSEGLEGWRAPAAPLDCGNSGTTARLLMGLLAGRGFCATLTGDASLRGRPMRRVTQPLTAMGARVRELEQPDRLPVELCGGALSPLDHRSPKASAQIKSAILLAGVSGAVPVRVHEPIRSRDHTERLLSALGAQIAAGPGAEGGWEVSLRPPEALPPLDFEVPGDPSSAAFVAALALLAGSGELAIRDVGLNPTRTGFYDALRRMGAEVSLEERAVRSGEPVGEILVRPGPLRGIELGAAEIPALIDEIPLLAVLAARAEGETIVRGAEELRAKESDRITALVANLRVLGVEAEELADGLVVRGTDRPLRGRVQAFHDHRIAMAFAVLGAAPGNHIAIDDPDVAAISFPGFWDLLRTLARSAPA